MYQFGKVIPRIYPFDISDLRSWKFTMEQNIFVNEVLYCNDEEQLYRVLWISAGQEYGYWIPVDGKMNGIPVKFDCKKVAGGLADGIITSVHALALSD